ncbi:hypothetical protein FCV66_16735 [Enterovibrio norvegicus]|nr:hypothetical protein [Enterovibrio norvegicus]TKF11889.1 hypothetical protein FCV66_16735 [Enterovibrio norvegicus]
MWISRHHDGDQYSLLGWETTTIFSSIHKAEMQETVPDLVLVNPPCRGLEKALVRQLVALALQHIHYSSCNPETLYEDIQAMPSYVVKRLQWFDMFPHTEHAEVMVLLEK